MAVQTSTERGVLIEIRPFFLKKGPSDGCEVNFQGFVKKLILKMTAYVEKQVFGGSHCTCPTDITHLAG